MELLQITTSVAQGMMAMPFIKWREILSVVGDALNMPHLADMIDQNAMMQMAQQQQAAQAGAMPGPSGGPPLNEMGEPNPIPASSRAGLQGAANRAM
jgi:hypothetical protein